MTPLLNRWNDERLDDLAHQVRATAAVATIVATHTAQIDAADDRQDRLERLLRDAVKDMREAMRELRDSRRFTVTQWVATLGPAVGCIAIAVALMQGHS